MNLGCKLTFWSTRPLMNSTPANASSFLCLCIQDAQKHEKPPQPESRRSNSIQAKQSVPGTLAIDPSTAGILWNRTKPTQMLLSVRMDELKDPHWGSKSASPSSLLLAIDPWQRHCSPYIPRLGFGAAPATALTRGRAGQTILEIAGRLPLRCSQITIL